MRIKITKPAYIDLNEIDRFIRTNNPSAANRMGLRVSEAIDFLVTYPAMGRTGRLSKTRELIVSGTPFIVIYQVRQSTLIVLRIMHTSRKWPNNKKH